MPKETKMNELDLKEKTGIRLKSLQIHNWGTFNGTYEYFPDGKNSLLTGESGSGKSTVVDALSTLLVNASKRTYNKAADASARERTEVSYVLGYYGKKSDTGAEALRDYKSYSVILGVFHNYEKHIGVTLAILFYFTDASTLKKLFVVSEEELSIIEDFNISKSIGSFKKTLEQKGAYTFDTYRQYSLKFKKLMGQLNDNAINIFNQTISMKKISSINSFVKDSILEKNDIDEHIKNLLELYSSLSNAYNAILTAEEMIKILKPISEKGKIYEKYSDEENKIKSAKESLNVWVARKKDRILQKKAEELSLNFKKAEQNLAVSEKDESLKEKEIDDLTRIIYQTGGGKIENLKREIETLEVKIQEKKNRLKKYNALAEKLGRVKAESLEIFNKNLEYISLTKEENKEKKLEIKNKIRDEEFIIKNTENETNKINTEIKSLLSRKSNIPSSLIKIREQMCSITGICANDLPFIGELIEVKIQESEWEGAIERLMHSFALSMLVGEENYDKVSVYVNRCDLNGKLVYYKVPKNIKGDEKATGKNTVISKITIKEDTIFTSYIKKETNRRFSHICAETIEEFRQSERAITKEGQIKQGLRHEKDDRQAIGKRSNYVLGFSNRQKIDNLKQDLNDMENKLKTHVDRLEKYEKEENSIEEILKNILLFKEYENFEELDFRKEERIVKDDKEKIEMLKKDDKLKNIEEKLEILKKEKAEIKIKVNSFRDEKTRLEEKIKTNDGELNENYEILSTETEYYKKQYPYLEENFKEINKNIAISKFATLQNSYLKILDNKLQDIQKKLDRIKSDIQSKMKDFNIKYPEKTKDITPVNEDINLYNKMLETLEYDDLPKYKTNFKMQLQSKVISEISTFNSLLLKQRESIKVKIEKINTSLKVIDYNSGRYIEIICNKTNDREIRDFYIDLKNCTENIFKEMDESELGIKFKKIEAILSRFRGRAESADADKRWTERVTDVRNYFDFSATERIRETEEEYEHYSDSDGKSGGQKEKLAYTVLAAGLAYNYKIYDNKDAFRTVVIDEAFLKSSDESAKFGLELFKNLDFQLITVTPLLKISVIEPYIAHACLVVHDDTSHRSNMKNTMTLLEVGKD